MPRKGWIWMLLNLIGKKLVTEKDLFSLAAQKGAGGHESRCRRVKRSLSELNRR